MKQRNLLRAIICFGLCVCLLGILLATAVTALETPYIPLTPDSETTENVDPPTDTETDQPQTTEEIEQPLDTEIHSTEKTEDPATDHPSDTDAIPTTGDSATEFFKKHGCKSTVSGAVVCFALLFSALGIKRKSN